MTSLCKPVVARMAAAALAISAAALLSGCAVYEVPPHPHPAYYTYGPPPMIYGGPHPYWGGGWGHGWR